MVTVEWNGMKVEIWSDIVCPWCYIGKRRFESALARFKHRDQVEIVWRSFELAPNSPRQVAGTLNSMIEKKLGVSPAKAAAMHAHLTELAAGEGLEYRLDQAKPGNTFDAHRLIHMATAHNLQGAAKERLLHAYFNEGLPIGDPDTLVKLGSEFGLEAEAVRSMLASDIYVDEVRADVERARMFGIGGVPFVALDETYGISGAQPADTFLDALEKAWAASHPLLTLGQGEGTGLCEGEHCDLPVTEGAAAHDMDAVEA
jgi:predicted DsbA family dithiol-disulfide isomerase